MDSGNLFILSGPTASGKSALALLIAENHPIVIINADSKQVYRDIPIITAQPTKEDQLKTEHYLYGHIDAHTQYHMSHWLDEVKSVVFAAWQKNKIPLLVGGTGLYIQQLINGKSPIPEIDPSIRKKLQKQCEEEGLASIYKRLEKQDPQTYQRISPNDQLRILRASEVFEQTRKPISWWHQQASIPVITTQKTHLFFLNYARKTLYKRANDRFLMMIDHGVVNEVKQLRLRRLNPKLPAMNAHGIPELLAYLNGDMLFENAIAKAQQNTRNYIKRQYTFFSHQYEHITFYTDEESAFMGISSTIKH